jgi:hypothetical protein
MHWGQQNVEVFLETDGITHNFCNGYKVTLPVAGLADNQLKPLQILTTEGNTFE